MSDKGKENLRKSAIKNLYYNKGYDDIETFERLKGEYHKNPKLCRNCRVEISYEKRHKIYCNKKCRNEFDRKNLTEFEKYKLDSKFKFGLSNYPEEFDFDLVRKYGWYKPVNRGNNINGVSRDHMFSVKDGFINKIDPKIISHPANCRLILQRKNSSKWKRSCITIDELISRIEDWNKKYLGP